MRITICRILLTLVLAGLCNEGDGQEWTRFRGPNGSGISEAKTVPVKWAADDYNWIAELPGRGHSSPVVWGDKLFVTSCDDESATRYLLCINTKSGAVDWQREFKFASYKKHKNNSYASSTPCVDENAVYVVWHSKQSSPLIALDHAGNPLWKHDLGPYLHGQGGAASPIVHEDLVILAHDQKEPSFLLAVDRQTGKPRWQIPRQGKRACYATPCVLTSADRTDEIIFTHCYEGIVGVDAKTGKQNWHIDVFGRDPQRALASPVLTDDLVVATSGGVGGKRQLVAVKPSGLGTDIAVSERFRTTRQAPHVPTPLVYKQWLFMWSDQGIVSCLDCATGQPIWQKRVGGNFFSSPVCIDGKLYGIDLDGNLSVIAAAADYELLARISLGRRSKSTPAVSGGTLFIRTESHVYSIGGT